MRTRRFQLFRARTLPKAGGGTLYFCTESAGRRHLSLFFDPKDVPEFEGESAWFEAEWRAGGWWEGGGWRIVRRVDVPDAPAPAPGVRENLVP